MQPLVSYLNQVIFPILDFFFVPLIFAIAFIVFLWGVYTYFILGAGNDEKRKEGRSFVVYAILGFVIMISVWGIVRLIAVSLNLGGGRPDTPKFGPSSALPIGETNLFRIS